MALPKLEELSRLSGRELIPYGKDVLTALFETGTLLSCIRSFFEDLEDDDLNKINKQLEPIRKRIVIHEAKSFELQEL